MGFHAGAGDCAGRFSNTLAWKLLSTFSLPALSGLANSCRAIGVRATWGDCRTVFSASSAIWNLALTFLRLSSAALVRFCAFADCMLARGFGMLVRDEMRRQNSYLAIDSLLSRGTGRLAA